MPDRPDEERRHFHRIRFPSEGTLELPDGVVGIEIIDLSLKGALVRPVRTVELSTAASYVLRLELSPEVTIVMTVRVAHQAPGRVGLSSTHIDIESAQHLRRLVELNLGDDALLHRDLTALADFDRSG